MKIYFISIILMAALLMGGAGVADSSLAASDEVHEKSQLIYDVLHAAYPKVAAHKMRLYARMIDELSVRHQLNWSLIPATIWVESQFNPAAESSQKARGLMQLLEGTAKAEARKAGIKYHEDKTIWNDSINLTLGAGYLGKAYDKERNYRHVSYYYIAGPRWRTTWAKSARARDCLETYALKVLGESEKLEALYAGRFRKSETDQAFIWE